MPHPETDSKSDANAESGSQARRGDEPRRDGETQPDSRLAGDRGDGPRSDGRRLPLTEVEPAKSADGATLADSNRTRAVADSPALRPRPTATATPSPTRSVVGRNQIAWTPIDPQSQWESTSLHI